MRTPEVVYQFRSQKDLATGTLDVYRFDTLVSSSASTQTITLLPFETFGRDRAFIISHVSAQVEPYSGNTPQYIRVYYGFGGSAPARYLFFAGGGDAADLNLTLDVSTEVWLPGFAIIQAQAAYSGGAATNNFRASIHGFVIPRGNVQL